MFFRILISYLVIMLVPVLVLAGILVNFLHKIYGAELLSGRKDNLSSFQIATDNLLNGLNANAFAMFQSKEFTTRYQRESYGNFYDITNKLRDFSFTNDFVNGIFYINRELKCVYTTHTIYNYQNFHDFQYKYGPPEETEDLLIRNARSYWIAAGPKEDEERQVLTYVVTDKAGFRRGDAAIIFQISAEKLDDLSGKLNGQKSCTLMAAPDGEILYTSNREISGNSWDVWVQSDQRRNDETVILTSNGVSYAFLQAPSTTSPILYATIVPYEEIMRPLESHQQIFFIGMGIIIILCAAFITYFMRVNYTPIRAISNLAASLFGSDDKCAENELESTRLALVKMKDRHANIMREKITLKLMRGGFQTLDELEREGEPYAYKLIGPLFRIVMFRIAAGNETPSMETYQAITQLIEDSISVYTDSVALNYSENDTVYLVISGEDEDMRGLMTKYSQIKNVIENTFSISISIGISNVIPIGEMTTAVSQAAEASAYSFVRGKSSITFYNELATSEPAWRSAYPTRTLDALYNAILQGDSERTAFAIRTLIQHMQSNNSYFYVTCLAYDILNTAMKAMRELDCEVSGFSHISFGGKGAPDSVDEIIGIVEHISNNITNILSENPDASQQPPVAAPQPNQLEQIMSYISEHYGSEALSVKSLAAQVNMSVSNLSHFFKKNTGQTVSEYISLLRFEKAKELLRETNMNLQDIATQCGYLHLSTFMRQFKQRAGCTPAIYRSNYNIKI